MAQILIIDDEESIRHSLAVFLGRDGHETFAAANGEEAFELLEKQTIDLILVDQLMPRLHGLGFMKQIHEMHLDLPVIMMTGHGTIRLAVEFMRSGGVDFVEKPFDMDVIKIKVEKAFQEKSLKDQLKRIEQAHRIADEANKAKSAFLANLSHELRSPMHVILSFASLGKQNAGAISKKLADYFERIEEAGNNLMTSLEDVITLAKLETERLPFDEEKIDVIKWISDFIRQYKMRTNFLQIEVVARPQEAFISADITQLNIVLEKLLDNAVTYGQNLPIRVIVELERKKTTDMYEAVITVADQGIGIPAEELDRVFDAFTLSSRTDKGTGGGGLGLAICKEIIKIHKGSIWAKNNPDKGCSVTFTLPLNIGG